MWLKLASKSVLNKYNTVDGPITPSNRSCGLGLIFNGLEFAVLSFDSGAMEVIIIECM